MSKPKKKRNKKYQPGRPKIPAWAYDAWGQLTEKDFKIFEDAVKIDLGLIRMGTDEKCRYGDLLYAMRQLFAFSEKFSQDTEYQLLATMGTAAIHALKNVTDNEKEGKPRCQAHVAALLAPLEHAISVYFTMMRELYRSEHEAARRQADKGFARCCGRRHCIGRSGRDGQRAKSLRYQRRRLHPRPLRTRLHGSRRRAELLGDTGTRNIRPDDRTDPHVFPRYGAELCKHRPNPKPRSCRLTGTSVCLSDLTDQEALALQAAINDALIELDNEAYDDNVRR